MGRSSSRMELVKDLNGLKVIKIWGVFTAETIPVLQKTCEKIAAEGNTKAVLLDFNTVERIDTSAFACMLNFIKVHTEEGIKIGAINLNRQEKNLVDVLRIKEVIPVFANEQEAASELLK